MVQVCGKWEVRRGSVKVDRPMKFWTIVPREDRPVSIIYRVSPPNRSTKASSPKNK